MKVSEKIEIVGTALAILAIFSLFQSPSFNTIGVLMVVRLLYRCGNILQENTKTGISIATVPGATEPEKPNSGIVGIVVDNVCSVVIAVELLSLPPMILYLISTYQTLNFVIGTILGGAFAIVGHGRILKFARIWVWFITFNLSLACIIAIKALSR